MGCFALAFVHVAPASTDGYLTSTSTNFLGKLFFCMLRSAYVAGVAR